MRRLTLILLTYFATAPLARPVAHPPATRVAQDEPAPTELERKTEKAAKLLDLNGTRAVQVRSVDKILAQFEAMGLSPEFGRRFKERFDIEEVLRFSVDIHAEKLDEETLDGLIAFYETPVGKTYAEAFPDINEAAMEAGMEYGKRIGEEVGREMGGGK